LSFKTTQFVVLYLVAVSDPDLVLAKSTGESNASVAITHRLYESEKELFKENLRLLSQQQVPVATILEFVIMASNYEPDDNYIEKIVMDALSDTDIYKGQAKLLLYLSMLNIYGGDHRYSFPEKHCRLLVSGDSKLSPAPEFMRSICSQARLFIIRDTEGRRDVNIRVPHAPVAKYLYKGLAKSTKLSEVTTKMLLEDQMIQEKYQNQVVHHTVRKFLVARSIKTYIIDEVVKDQFSPAITEMCKMEGYLTAARTLETGFLVLRRIEKSFIAQTMARLYMRNQETRRSIECAEKAIEAAELIKNHHRFPCYDTLGHCHKAALRYALK
jgi:hypothetical protein